MNAYSTRSTNTTARAGAKLLRLALQLLSFSSNTTLIAPPLDNIRSGSVLLIVTIV